MLVGLSKPELIFVRVSAALLIYPGLICFAYFVLAALAGGVPAIAHPFSILIEVYGAIEILWYVFWFLPFKHRLQKRGLVPARMTKEERKELFTKGMSTAPDLETYVRGWFNKAHMEDSRRDNLKEWLLWSLFGRDGKFGDDTAELDEYIQELEERMMMTFRKGRGDAKALRLSFDPIKMTHRSLLFYSITGFADLLTTLFLFSRGFKFYRQPRNTFFSVFPFRPMTLFSSTQSVASDMSYFYRPHTSKRQRPIVFIHGIGIGVTPYLVWLNSVPRDVGVIAIELLAVSNKICPPMPSSGELVDSISKILAQHGTEYNSFVLVGNSYGTLLISPMLGRARLRDKIDSVVLVDPVSLLLHLPDVAWNFTRRRPRTGPEWEIYYGAATDPMVAHTLARRFDFRDAMLWREQLLGRRATVILGGRDCVTHPAAVASYVYYGDVEIHDFAEERAEAWKATPETWTGQWELELMYLDGLDHGQAFLKPGYVPVVQKVVDTYCWRDAPGGEFRKSAGGGYESG
ncbi:hypothetical protein KVR01_001979 [Diaporthe batatas]|uniref:uncharacterized protein n=1 Tax=Diaporthe batatas TaxID=748121 RepID=UPI001D04201F|nr:uncharacterized protein KVR01_001979 [Diaporthe batatas]KAG8169230.1 hypothetical protein KVR01_001979 [Diaporthe batatas]